MNAKVTTTIAVLSFSFAVIAAGCESPPTNLILPNSSAAGSGGSGSGGSTGSGSGNTAHDYFVNTVYPMLETAPSSNPCASCHSTGLNGAPIFMSSNAEGSYTAITNYGGGKFVATPANSILVLHGAHTGPAMDPDEKNDVIQWLTMEVNERGLGSGSAGSGGGMTLEDALTAYGSCMDMTDWTTNQLDFLYNQQTVGFGPCESCHSTGLGGNWLSSNAQETFSENQKFPFVLREVTGTVDSQGNFKDLVPSNRWINKGSEPCQPNTDCHPKYTLPQTMIDGITTFVNDTLDKFHAGACTPDAGP